MPTWVSFLIFLWSSVCSNELGESTVILNELSISPHLTDLPTVQHHNEITLREEAKTMGDKNAGLGGGGGRVKWQNTRTYNRNIIEKLRSFLTLPLISPSGPMTSSKICFPT